MLELTNLTRAFRRRGELFNAVDKVNLQVHPGELVVISGRSGNGKTTLLNLIMGILEPSQGTVTWNGQDIATLDDAALSRLRCAQIGYVTQRETLLAALSVWDNVLLPATFYSSTVLTATSSGVSTAEAGAASSPSQEPAWQAGAVEQRAQYLLERLQVAHLAQSYPKELSGGEIRRVAIARALINSPALFLADEPTGDLDQQSTELVLGLLRDIAHAGTAVIMVTHDPDSLRFADRLLTMTSGHLAAS